MLPRAFFPRWIEVELSTKTAHVLLRFCQFQTSRFWSFLSLIRLSFHQIFTTFYFAPSSIFKIEIHRHQCWILRLFCTIVWSYGDQIIKVVARMVGLYIPYRHLPGWQILRPRQPHPPQPLCGMPSRDVSKMWSLWKGMRTLKDPSSSIRSSRTSVPMHRLLQHSKWWFINWESLLQN